MIVAIRKSEEKMMATITPREQNERSPSAEEVGHDHPGRRAVLERLVPGVDLVERDLLGDQVVEVHPALEVHRGVEGDVPLEVRGAHVDALHLLRVGERAQGADVDARVRTGDPDEVEAAAPAEHLEALRGDGPRADEVEDVVRAAAGQLADRLDGVVRAGVDDVRRAEGPRPLQLPVLDVRHDDQPRPREPRAAHRVHPDAARAHDDHGLALPHVRAVEYRARPRQDPAAEQRGRCEGHLLRDDTELVLVDERFLREAAEPGEVPDGLAVPAQPGGLAGGADRRLGALAEVRTPREAVDARAAVLDEAADDVVADADLGDVGARRGDDARDLVAEDGGELAAEEGRDAEVGVAEPGGPHLDPDLVPCRLGERDVLDDEALPQTLGDCCLHVPLPYVACPPPDAGGRAGGTRGRARGDGGPRGSPGAVADRARLMRFRAALPLSSVWHRETEKKRDRCCFVHVRGVPQAWHGGRLACGDGRKHAGAAAPLAHRRTGAQDVGAAERGRAAARGRAARRGGRGLGPRTGRGRQPLHLLQARVEPCGRPRARAVRGAGRDPGHLDRRDGGADAAGAGDVARGDGGARGARAAVRGRLHGGARGAAEPGPPPAARGAPADIGTGVRGAGPWSAARGGGARGVAGRRVEPVRGAGAGGGDGGVALPAGAVAPGGAGRGAVHGGGGGGASVVDRAGAGLTSRGAAPGPGFRGAARDPAPQTPEGLDSARGLAAPRAPSTSSASGLKRLTGREGPRPGTSVLAPSLSAACAPAPRTPSPGATVRGAVRRGWREWPWGGRSARHGRSARPWRRSGRRPGGPSSRPPRRAPPTSPRPRRRRAPCSDGRAPGGLRPPGSAGCA
ncbi:putative zinc-binding alcohol dehydrogenase [Streptomyces sp. Tu6071]|nr:putative zinc-binding alcohol dehydrogenase [Streptomyces sp. Tu6071]